MTATKPLKLYAVRYDFYKKSARVEAADVERVTDAYYWLSDAGSAFSYRRRWDKDEASLSPAVAIERAVAQAKRSVERLEKDLEQARAELTSIESLRGTA